MRKTLFYFFKKHVYSPRGQLISLAFILILIVIKTLSKLMQQAIASNINNPNGNPQNLVELFYFILVSIIYVLSTPSLDLVSNSFETFLVNSVFNSSYSDFIRYKLNDWEKYLNGDLYSVIIRRANAVGKFFKHLFVDSIDTFCYIVFGVYFLIKKYGLVKHFKYGIFILFLLPILSNMLSNVRNLIQRKYNESYDQGEKKLKDIFLNYQLIHSYNTLDLEINNYRTEMKKAKLWFYLYWLANDIIEVVNKICKIILVIVVFVNIDVNVYNQRDIFRHMTSFQSISKRLNSFIENAKKVVESTEDILNSKLDNLDANGTRVDDFTQEHLNTKADDLKIEGTKVDYVTQEHSHTKADDLKADDLKFDDTNATRVDDVTQEHSHIKADDLKVDNTNATRVDDSSTEHSHTKADETKVDDATQKHLNTKVPEKSIDVSYSNTLDLPLNQLKKDSLDQNIKIVNLSKRYGEKLVFKNLNFTIQKGDKVAISGINGSGKSSFIKSLIGIESVEGQILIDGIDSHEIEESSYSRLFSYVPQDSVLFSSTLYENITSFNTKLDPLTVFSKVKEFEMETAFKEIGYNRVLSEGGSHLSSAQRQKISLMRAVIRDSPIVLFDEVTSEMDKEYESVLVDIIMNKMRNKTVLMVIHNLDLLPRFNKVIFFNNNTASECSSYFELLKQGEFKDFVTGYENK